MNYNVPPEYSINVIKKSTVKTINNYPKNDVIMALIDCLSKGLVVDSNYWAAELFASGFYLPLWDCLFKYYFQYVHILNPHFIDYLNQKHLLMNAIKKIYSGNLKNLCNNQELRNHISEIVTLFCLSNNQMIEIPEEVKKITIDDNIADQVHQIIQNLMPNLSKESMLYEQLYYFAINYYQGEIENCIYYIKWFLDDSDYTISPFEEFKVPSSIAQKSMWLIWKFLIYQYEDISDDVMDTLELLIHIYILVYRRKDRDTCCNILHFIIVMILAPSGVNWSQSLDLTNSAIIQQTAGINIVYRNLQMSHEKIVTEQETQPKNKGGRSKKKNKKEQEKERFYQNQKNIDFLTLLNDTETLLMGQIQKQQLPDSEDYLSDDEPETQIIYLDRKETRKNGKGSNYRLELKDE